MTFTPELVSGIGALLFSAIGTIVGMLGPELLFPLWRMFGARSVPLSRFASVGLGLFGGFVGGIITPFFAPAGQMFYTEWWGFLLAAANAGGVIFTGAMIASVP
ncbi:MAG TPA: hypothetical protein VGF41_14025, partial [Myxococcaceae bacterium]